MKADHTPWKSVAERYEDFETQSERVIEQRDKMLLLIKEAVAEYDSTVASMVNAGAFIDGNPLIERMRDIIEEACGELSQRL